jgi:hypothetical protein
VLRNLSLGNGTMINLETRDETQQAHSHRDFGPNLWLRGAGLVAGYFTATERMHPRRIQALQFIYSGCGPHHGLPGLSSASSE